MRMPFPLKAPPQICVSIRGSKTTPATLAFIRGNPCSSVAKKPPPPPSVARLCVCAARGHARCRGHTTLERLHRNARKLPGDTPPFRGTHAAWGHTTLSGRYTARALPGDRRCPGTHHFGPISRTARWRSFAFISGAKKHHLIPPAKQTFKSPCAFPFAASRLRVSQTVRKAPLHDTRRCLGTHHFAMPAAGRCPGTHDFGPLSRTARWRTFASISGAKKTTPDPPRTTDIQEPLCVYP